MELGMNELRRIGTSMLLRPSRAGQQSVVYDLHSEAKQALVKESGRAAAGEAGA
jgi:6-phosphogluconate dehydrogenase (decarboxylating)